MAYRRVSQRHEGHYIGCADAWVFSRVPCEIDLGYGDLRRSEDRFENGSLFAHDGKHRPMV